MSSLSEVRFLDRRSPPHILTLVCITGLSALALNIFLPSLPRMTAYFDTDYRLMQLSVSLYLLVSAALQVIIGPISDRFGRRRVLMWSLVLFLLATLGTLVATSAVVFLVFRMLQAVIAAGMVLSRAVVRDMVPGAEAASMIGYVTMGMSIVPMIGPLIGGALDQAFGWQASFLLLLGLGGAVLALTWADLGETMQGARMNFGAQVRQYPGLLTSRRFWGYCLAAAFSSGSFFAFLGGAPYVGTKIYGLSPTELGLAFAAPSLGYAFGNFLSGRFSVRVGMNRMVLWGTLIASAGLGLLVVLEIAGQSGPLVFFGLITSIGLGNGMTLPNANAGMLSVRRELAGTASGLGGAIIIGGGAAISALAGFVLTLGGGALPLAMLMFVSALVSVAMILLVIRRARRLGL